MVGPSEECFPRGGVKHKRTAAPKEIKKQENLFGITQDKAAKNKSKKEKKKSAAQEIENANNVQPKSLVAESLSYSKIQEGMLIIGCVRKIKSLSMEIELPGRTHGELLIKSVSTQYYNELNRRLDQSTDNEKLTDLSDIFNVGQYLPTRVVNHEETEKGHKVHLSCNPKEVNYFLQHKHVKKGMLVWGAVAEKSDHAYIIDIGVNSCRAVLPFKEMDEGAELEIGKPLYMVIIKSENMKEAATITLSAKRDVIANTCEGNDLSLDHLVPGMQVNFLVEKLIKDGCEGKFCGEYVGYVNEFYLPSQLDTLKKVKEMTTVKARVLYTQPTTKFTYLTLRGFDTEASPVLKLGSNIPARIVTNSGRGGVVLRINKIEKGLVSYKRIAGLIGITQGDLKEAVQKKYAIGSEHRCKILDYNHIERLYLCTFEPAVVKSGITTRADLKHGQLVKGVIKNINNAGILIGFGTLEGFVNNIHLSSSMYSENIKQKFKVGQHVQAKVWHLEPDSDNIKLTMKPELLQSDLVLSTYAGAVRKQEFSGVVVRKTNEGALVVFYGNVKGWLPKANIPQAKESNAKEIFYEGEVIKCCAIHCENEKLTLTMERPKLPANKQLKIGSTITNAKVKELEVDGLRLAIRGDIEAFLPKGHLAVGSFGNAFLNSYKVGTNIPELLAIDRTTVSLTESLYYKERVLQIPTFSDVTKDSLLRATFATRTDNGIRVNLPIKEVKRSFVVNKSLVPHCKRTKFNPRQVVVVKVLDVDDKKKSFKLSARLKDVFDYDFMYSINYLGSLIADVAKAEKLDTTLSGLKIGQQVECTVNNVDLHRGCSVIIKPNNVVGLVELNHMPTKTACEPNTTINGVILWINYELNYVTLTLREKYVEYIKGAQSTRKKPMVNQEKNCYTNILIANDKVAVGMIRGGPCSGQLVFLPVRLHENDVKPNINYYNDLLLRKSKVNVIRQSGGRLIGIEKGMKKMLAKQALLQKTSATKKQAQKRKLDDPKAAVEKKKQKVVSAEESDEGIVVADKKSNKKSAKQKKIEEKMDVDESDHDDDANSTSEIDEDADSTEENDDVDSAEEIDEDVNSSDEIDVDVDSAEEIDEESEEDEEMEEDSSVQEGSEVDVDEEESENEEVVANVDSDAAIDDDENDDNASVTDEDADSDDDNEDVETETNPALPGMSSFFQDEDEDKSDNKSSSDEEEHQERKEKKKKKLTPAERAEKAREEEDKLRKIENELADTSLLPQSAEQFDRVLLGNPDDSEMWLRYIAFHAQSTEFEKARTVAKRALEKMSYTANQDRLNVWLAYLNLENMYGTKESFDKVFEEASRCSDALTVYLEAIRMLADMQKFPEMEEKVKKVRGKFKQEVKMWLEIGKIYYSCERFADARKIKDAALKTLVDKKTHVSLIVQFAIMEFNEGEQIQGEALFETILQSDPKRVDVWSTYVDHLIKHNQIELARSVLGRAVGQKLPYKKMRTLFKKYHSFEKQFGNEETLEHVKGLLKEFTTDK